MHSSGFDPRTFNGRRAIHKSIHNTTLETPELNTSDDHVISFTSGVLSTRIVPVAYVMAIIIGIPSNTLILVSLSGKTRTVSCAILYLSLAASDLLLLLSLVLRVHYRLNGSDWVFGEPVCKLVTACFYGNVYSSIQAHMCIGVLRYLAVVHPFHYRSLSKLSCTTWASLSIWIVFAASMIPELVARQSYRLANVGITTCHDILPYEDANYKLLIPYRLCLVFLGFVFPFGVITFTYGCIVCRLSRSSCDFAHYINASSVVFVIFVLCFTPSGTIHFAHYVRLYGSQEDDFYTYFSAAVCVCCFHSCLDPFLAYFLTKTSNSNVDFISLSSVSRRTSAVV